MNPGLGHWYLYALPRSYIPSPQLPLLRILFCFKHYCFCPGTTFLESPDYFTFLCTAVFTVGVFLYYLNLYIHTYTHMCKEKGMFFFVILLSIVSLFLYAYKFVNLIFHCFKIFYFGARKSNSEVLLSHSWH